VTPPTIVAALLSFKGVIKKMISARPPGIDFKGCSRSLSSKKRNFSGKAKYSCKAGSLERPARVGQYRFLLREPMDGEIWLSKCELVSWIIGSLTTICLQLLESSCTECVHIAFTIQVEGQGMHLKLFETDVGKAAEFHRSAATASGARKGGFSLSGVTHRASATSSGQRVTS